MNQAIDSTFVSSVGVFVDRFERDMASYTASPRALEAPRGWAQVVSTRMCRY